MALVAKRFSLIAGLSAWLLITAYFSYQMLIFDTTPGPRAAAPGSWPARSSIHRAPGRKQLLMFVHPECSCTVASLDQLRFLEKRLGNRIEAHVVIWHSHLSARKHNWPEEGGGAEVVDDRLGQEAVLFGAKTSGQTMIYDEAGQLLFSGGLTALRADFSGAQVLRKIVERVEAKNQAGALEKPVFGCPITASSNLKTTLWTSLLP